MGSADKMQARFPRGEKLVSVQTSELKEILNQFYGGMREAALKHRLEPGHFDLLWDLKELALLESCQSVEVPETWLEEMESLDIKPRVQYGH